MRFGRADIISGLAIGESLAWLFFLIAKNLNLPIFFFWILPIALPILAVLGLYIAFLIGRKFLIFFQVAKFVLVGALNTLIDLGILNGLIFFSGIAAGPFYSIFKGISFFIATINSYFWNKFWTFKRNEEITATPVVPREFIKFLSVTTIGILLNVSIASFVVNAIGPRFGADQKLWATVGAFIATLVAWVWNFFGSKFIVFKNSH